MLSKLANLIKQDKLSKEYLILEKYKIVFLAITLKDLTLKIIKALGIFATFNS